MPFVDDGTYGCVFSPALKCTDKRKLQDNTVGKIFSDYDEFTEEKATNVMIVEKLDPKHKWTVPYLGTCETNIKESNEKDEIKKCKHISKSDKIKEQLILTYGGISLRKLCENIDKYPDFTLDEFILMFLPMMRGIITLDKEKLCHLDIKPANILYNIDQNKLYLIDFGLLTSQSELLEQDSIISFDYPYFPPEFKMCYTLITTDTTLKSSDYILSNFKLYDKNKFLQELKPFIDYDEQLKIFLDKYKDNGPEFIETYENKYSSKVDIYSLGMSFFEVYYFLKINNKLRINNNDFVNECIKKVFSKMIHPNADERCIPNKAYKELSKIIRYYKSLGLKVTVSLSPSPKSKSKSKSPVRLPNISTPKKDNSRSPTNYSTYTVKQLKVALKEKGRSVTGNKDTLLERVSKTKTPPVNVSTLTQAQCEKLKTSQIKELLQERNKPIHGNKKTLCERLLQ